MNFLRISILQLRFAIEGIVQNFVPVLLKAVFVSMGLGVLSVGLVVGIWQGSILAFGREATEAVAADVVESVETIRITFDKSWHWAPAVQAKVAQAWVTNYCPADDFDVFLNMVGQDKVVLSCELGTQKGKDVVFRTEDLKEENLGSGINGLSFLYEVGKVRVTPYQLLSSWVSMLFS